MNTKYAALSGLAIVVVGAVAWGAFARTAVAPEPVATTTPPTTTPPVEPPTIAPYQSGVEGSVTLTNTCPGPQPAKPDPAAPCERPFATAVSVYRANTGVPFVIGTSDQNGSFKISLPPGQYTLRAGDGTKLPNCASVNVTVAARGYVAAAITCDSGIR